MNADVPERIDQFARDAVRERLTGSVTLHFVGGEVRSWEIRETGRLLGPSVRRLDTAKDRAVI